MRTFLSILGILCALVMCAVSGAMNFLFLSSLGKTSLEGHVLGAASAAADLLKSLLPFFIAWSWSARRFVVAISGTIAFVFFAGFSLLSAIGFAADNRGVLVETRKSLTATYQRIQNDLQSTEAKRTALLAHRPASVVTEHIQSHKQNRRWNATTGCQDATGSESRLYCERYFNLRAELAAAQEADRLVVAVADLRSEAAKLRDAGAGQERDPQVSLLSKIFVQEQDTVRLALVIVVAMLVELGSSLGLFLSSGYQVSAKTDEDANGSSNYHLTPAIKVPTTGSVEDFCLNALQPTSNVVLNLETLHKAYQAWCVSGHFESIGFTEFSQTIAELFKNVGINCVSGGYSGISLISAFSVKKSTCCVQKI